MPPKKASKTLNNTPSKTSATSKQKNVPIKISDTDKNAISNMFKKIESKDYYLIECKQCNQKIKSCLFKDHMNTKCPNRKNDSSPHKLAANSCLDDDIIVLSDDEPQAVVDTKIEPKNEIKDEIKHETKLEIKSEEIKQEVVKSEEVKQFEDLEKLEPDCKRIKVSDEIEAAVLNNFEDDKDDELLLSQIERIEQNIKDSSFSNPEEHASKKEPTYDYYLNNFETAIKTVINEETFSHLLDDFDRSTIKKFSNLSISSRILYVRLFQRKYKWLNLENIIYEKISTDLTPNLDELREEAFLIDENSIDSYEELIYLLKLPQLKELAKMCHVINLTQTAKLRSEFIKLILQHFRTQKSLKFGKKSPQKEINSSSPKPQFMLQCKKILGKCYKLNQDTRDVFVRILMLFSLSSTCHFDPNKKDNAQQNFLQMLLVNIGKVKYMIYDVKLTISIFENRDALIRYQEALDYEFDLLSYIDAKETEEAYEKFNEKIYEFKKIILNPDLNEFDMNLPIYLRSFTPGSTYTKFISIYAFEVLQKLKKFSEANELFEFLITKQTTYLLSYRSKWYERLALNYEAHLKNPFKAYETLCLGLEDKQYVRKAGRLALYNRLVKMNETKKYLKIKDLSMGLKEACAREKYDYFEAPTYEIEGTILHSEFIPGRKNIFIQNYEPNLNDDDSTQSQKDDLTSASSNILIKNAYNISVEQVALTHYIKDLGFTHGKHAETRTITTIYALLFWNIIFDNSVNNVFVDKFQTSPLDLQTDYFYLNRKELIDGRVDLILNSPIEFICELITETWNLYNGVECSMISWTLFESLDECLSLIRCFNGIQLAGLCKYISQNYRYCRSGGPDLIIWSTKLNKCRFVEVKGPGDRLSFKQLVWLDFLMQTSIDCEVCYVKGQNSKRLRN